MQRGLNFAERPTPMDWGELKHVPLNITEVENPDENGKMVKSYIADIVPKVKQPLTVENIVKAAIDAEYGEDAQKAVMLNIASTDNAQVKAFQEFVKEITEAAKAEGYK